MHHFYIFNLNLDNLHFQIETHKLEFREKAQARTDTGFVTGPGSSQGGSQYTGSDRGDSPVPTGGDQPEPTAAE